MKNLIKLSILVLTVLVSVNANAQSTSEAATVEASATIVGALTVSHSADLAFGDILTSESPTINATSGSGGAVSVAGATTGQLLNVSIAYPDSLVGTGVDLNFSPVDATTAAAVNNSSDAPGSAAGLTGAALSGVEGDLGRVLTGTYNATGTNGFIYVGGRVDGATGTAGVTYASDITITVSYN